MLPELLVIEKRGRRGDTISSVAGFPSHRLEMAIDSRQLVLQPDRILNDVPSYLMGGDEDRYEVDSTPSRELVEDAEIQMEGFHFAMTVPWRSCKPKSPGRSHTGNRRAR